MHHIEIGGVFPPKKKKKIGVIWSGRISSTICTLTYSLFFFFFSNKKESICSIGCPSRIWCSENTNSIKFDYEVEDVIC